MKRDNRLGVHEDRYDRNAYLPTAEQIAASCAEVQANWSESDRRRRGGEKRAWTPPVLSVETERGDSLPGV